MSILIKDLQMPRTCGDCRFLIAKGKYPCWCSARDFAIKPSETDMRDGLCPLSEVPMTNAEKFKEVFGVAPKNCSGDFLELPTGGRTACEDCKDSTACSTESWWLNAYTERG